MNKKQVGALLKTMAKDDLRPVLTHVLIDKWADDVVLVASNGYIMAIITIDDDAEVLVGKLIRRDAIERWHKLATGKSRLDGEALKQVLNDDYGHHGEYAKNNYPEWKKVIPVLQEASKFMRFNAEYARTLQELDGGNALEYALHGKLGGMVARTERGTYIMMPMR